MGSFVFLSYARTDQVVVGALSKRLADAQIATFIDRRIVTGQDWVDRLQQAIDDCGAFVVIMSPESSRSKWVRREILRAEERRKLIVPLLLRGDRFFQLSDHQHAVIDETGRIPTNVMNQLARACGAAAPAAKPTLARAILSVHRAGMVPGTKLPTFVVNNRGTGPATHVRLLPGHGKHLLDGLAGSASGKAIAAGRWTQFVLTAMPQPVTGSTELTLRYTDATGDHEQKLTVPDKPHPSGQTERR